MDHKLLLCKSLTLLYRESQLAVKSENSNDLVRTVLENIQVSEMGIGISTDRDIIIALKSTILEMCNNPVDHAYDKLDLLQRVKLNAGHDEKLYECMLQGIDEDLNESVLKRMVTNIRKQIMNHFREQQISDVLNKASAAFKFNRDKIKDVNQFVTEIIGQLEPLQLTSGSKDPAVINDIDLGDDNSVKQIFSEIQKSVTGKKVYKTGWQALNRMLQGGFRPSETWMINALQHKYKTGFTLSLFKQFALYNKPFTEDPNKKPLIIRISFEDELKTNLQFLYQSLKYDELSELVSVDGTSVEEMQSYVKQRLHVNGFHIKMIRVDPTMWSYKNICNRIIELEAEGYSVEILMVDYLAMVPTVGCINTGPMGTDIRDLFRRLRNFCSP
jgi:hypothetical protein